MTTINDVSTNDMNFKHLDTTKNIVITPKNEFGGQVLLNTAHTWTAKVSDETNYIGNYPVTFESNSIVVNSAEFTKLPAGNYHLEVWEEWTDANGSNQRSIYPSPKETIPFRIYGNVTDLAEKEIKTIGFQDVVDQAVMNIGMNYVFKVNVIEPDQTATVVQSAADGKNYVTFNIPKGDKGDKGDVGPAPTFKIGTVTKLNSDQTPTVNVSGDNGAYVLDLGIPQGPKGDTGTVDNAGLTTAPAFVNLQTQVDNSAVGTNLITGTSYFTGWTLSGGTAQGTTDGLTYAHLFPGASVVAPDLTLAESTTYTVSFDALGYTSGKTPIGIGYSKDSNGGTISSDHVNATLNALDGASVRVSLTFTTPSSFTKTNFNIGCGKGYGTGGSLFIRHVKLEKGSVATDWCPNPTEILTQSDYAKIKAAIVALGGALS